MRLESIALHGFKSFGDKTVVRILPGITGIVGPNGCGKSNVGEAVRWALGEQSAKSLRGQRMEDLIFHGSQSRKPVGLAEVELTFRNDGTLSVPWAEVSVARRLYRTGESEYLLNGGAARLRDILDLFAGTGANPRAYSVMDQDKLNHVLTAKPHERRVFIEEAAGIARYKQQRNETQGKLDAARQNLVRVRDVMDEVKRQLASLERQAKKAQQYKALQTTKRDLSLVVVAAEYMARVAEGERLAAELGRLRDREQALRTRSAQLAAQEAQQRERLQESDHRLSDLRQSVQKVQGELERLLERREQMGLQLRELGEEAVRLDEEIRATADRLAAIVGEREAGRQALADASRLAAEGARTADALAADLERHREALAAERDRAEAARLEHVRVAAERIDLMRHAGELREREAQLRRRAERLAVELGQAEAEAAGIDALRASLAQARDVTRTELGELASERDRLATRLAADERRLAEAEAALANARVALAAHRSSLDALAALERAREGYGAGVRAVFDQGRAAALAGVVGTVADLLEVPAGMERAIEAVLGERLQWVVVERFEHARAAVEYLRAHSLGAATFLPLEHLPPPPGPQPDANGVRWVARSVAASSLSLVTTSWDRWRSSSTSTRRRHCGGGTESWRRTSRRLARCSARPDGSTVAARRRQPRSSTRCSRASAGCASSKTRWGVSRRAWTRRRARWRGSGPRCQPSASRSRGSSGRSTRGKRSVSPVKRTSSRRHGSTSGSIGTARRSRPRRGRSRWRPRRPRRRSLSSSSVSVFFAMPRPRTRPG